MACAFQGLLPCTLASTSPNLQPKPRRSEWLRTALSKGGDHGTVEQITQGLAEGHPDDDYLVRRHECLLSSWRTGDLRPGTAAIRDAHDLRPPAAAHAYGHADSDAYDLRSATTADGDAHDLRSTAAATIGRGVQAGFTGPPAPGRDPGGGHRLGGRPDLWR